MSAAGARRAGRSDATERKRRKRAAIGPARAGEDEEVEGRSTVKYISRCATSRCGHKSREPPAAIRHAMWVYPLYVCRARAMTPDVHLPREHPRERRSARFERTRRGRAGRRATRGYSRRFFFRGRKSIESREVAYARNPYLSRRKSRNPIASLSSERERGARVSARSAEDARRDASYPTTVRAPLEKISGEELRVSAISEIHVSSESSSDTFERATRV